MIWCKVVMDKAKTKTEKSCATSVLSNLIMRWQTSSETSNRKSAGLTTLCNLVEKSGVLSEIVYHKLNQ